MNQRKNIIKYIILWCFLFLPFNFVNAARSINNNLLEFSLTVANQNTQFNFTSNTYNTRTDQLGINWYESFSHYFHAGLELGYVDMSQRDNPIISAQYTSGQYAGLLLRFLPIDNHSLLLTLNFNYRFNRTQGETINQKTQFDWNETLLFAELRYFPVKSFSLLLATEYQLMEGEQQDSGTVTQISPFNESTQQSYRFGVHFLSNRTGTVGLEWLTGFKSGTRLYFSRNF